MKLRIPIDWDIVSLVTLVLKHKAGIFKNQNSYGSGSNIVGVADLYYNSLIDGQIFRLVSLTEQEKIEYSLSEGDIIYAESSLVRDGIGKALYVSERGRGTTFAWHTRKIVLNDKAISKYIYYLLDFQLIRNSIISRATTTALTGIPMNEYFQTKFPLPSKIEQKKIVTILSKVDELIQKANQVIEQTQRLKKGLMQRILIKGVRHTKFKKVKTFFAEHLEIPENWRIVQLKEIADIHYGLSQPPELDEQGIPMIRATNIKKGLIHEKDLLRIKASSIPNSRDVYLQHGDIIVVRSGAYTGDIGYIPKRFDGSVAGYDLIVSPTKEVDSIWLTNYLLSSRVQNYFSQLKSRVAQPHLNAQELSNTQVYLPPFEEQQKIVDIILNTDNRITSETNYRFYLRRLKQGLMQKLLTGKIRVEV
jgi:type I restriction enzyme, S subunit